MSKKKIVFLKPCDFMCTEYNGTSNPQNFPIFPYSLAIVLAYVKKNLGENFFDYYGIDAYLFKNKMNGAASRIVKIEPDIIVANINVLTFHLVKDYFVKFKKKSKIIALINKPFAKDMIEKHGDVLDVIIEKEWNAASLDAIHAVLENQDLKNIKGIYLNIADKALSTESRKHQPIYEYPIPAFLEFQAQKYHFFFTNWSEGCMHGCIFCPFGTAVYGVWQAKKVKKIIEELQILYSIIKRPIVIYNIDNELTLDKKWAMKLFSTIHQSKIPMLIDANIRANNLDEKRWHCYSRF